MNILIAYPPSIVFSEYYSNKNILFIDESGWWIYDHEENKRNFYSIGFSKKSSLNIVNPDGLRDSLNWFSPIWTRWVAKSFYNEQNRIKSFEIIDNIVSDLNLLKIKFSIINTSVAHHVDTVLLQLSLANVNIPQVFLYSNVLDGRLIPIFQNKSIFDRKIISSNISEINYGEILDSFLKNKMEGNSPKQNTSVTKIKKNLYFSILYILFYSIRKYIKNNLLFNIRNRKKWCDFYKEINLFESIDLMFTQRSYLKFYDKVKLTNNESFNNIESGKVQLLIAAHYQPEATSFPEGGNFSSHIEIIMKIRSLGYSNIIGYKEHPATWMYRDKIIGMTRVGIYRSKEYLNQLMRLNCIIINENFTLPISEKQREKYIPVTISGTIAIERSLLGLHTIVAGEPWYKGMPGTIMLEDLLTLNVIPSEWLMYSSDIKTQARSFLLNKLNNSTITNSIGVGTGILIHDKKLLNIFKNEFNNLLNLAEIIIHKNKSI